MDNIINNMDETQIKNMITLLQSMLSSKNSEENNIVQSSKNSNKNTQKKNNRKKSITKSVNEEKNKFLLMPEANMHKDDSRIDALLSKQPPVSRSRKFEYINVKCRLCGKEEKVSPGILTDTPSRYKCNRCSASQG